MLDTKKVTATTEGPREALSPTLAADLRIVGASVAGRDHLLIDRANQDAFAWWSDGDQACAVVCDGCSSGRHSDVGAKLAARAIIGLVAAHANKPLIELQQTLQSELLAKLRQIALALAVEDSQLPSIISDYMLFTIVGAVWRHDQCCLFTLGDGAIWVDGVPIVLGPFADNAPPYLAYHLVESLPTSPEEISWHRLDTIPTRLVLASDGICRLGTLGPQLIDTRCFDNHDRLRRRMLTARRSNPALGDDLTLVAMYRRQRT